jgi:hypothetical protein
MTRDGGGDTGFLFVGFSQAVRLGHNSHQCLFVVSFVWLLEPCASLALWLGWIAALLWGMKTGPCSLSHCHKTYRRDSFSQCCYKSDRWQLTEVVILSVFVGFGQAVKLGHNPCQCLFVVSFVWLLEPHASLALWLHWITGLLGDMNTGPCSLSHWYKTFRWDSFS